jgi:hypothetical protein
MWVCCISAVTNWLLLVYNVLAVQVQQLDSAKPPFRLGMLLQLHYHCLLAAGSCNSLCLMIYHHFDTLAMFTSDGCVAFVHLACSAIVQYLLCYC